MYTWGCMYLRLGTAGLNEELLQIPNVQSPVCRPHRYISNSAMGCFFLNFRYWFTGVSAANLVHLVWWNGVRTPKRCLRTSIWRPHSFSIPLYKLFSFFWRTSNFFARFIWRFANSPLISTTTFQRCLYVLFTLKYRLVHHLLQCNTVVTSANESQ